VSSSLPAQIQELRNLIQGILRGLRGKEFTPTHPGFSLTPHFFCYLSLWPGKASAHFLPREPSHPNPVLLCPSCRTATCSTEALVAQIQEHPHTAPHTGAKKSAIERNFLLDVLIPEIRGSSAKGHSARKSLKTSRNSVQQVFSTSHYLLK